MAQQEQEQHGAKTKKGLLNAILNWAPLAVLAVPALYGSYRLGQDSYSWLETPPASFPSRPEKPVLPSGEDGKLDQTLSANLMVALNRYFGSYNAFRNFGQDNLQKLLNTRQPEKVVELIEGMNKNSIIEGANILQTAWLLGFVQEKVILDFKQDSVWIDDNHYNLNNRYETQLASAWIQAKNTLVGYQLALQVGYGNNDIDSYFNTQEAEDDLAVLNWLRRRGAPVNFKEETFTFFPKDEMVALGRVWQFADRLGLNIPTQVEWCAGCLNTLEGKQITVKEDGALEVKRGGKVGGIPTEKGGVILENTNLVDSLVHEEGHVVSRVKNYLQQFADIRGYRGVAANISERSNFVSEYAMADVDEDFAETFSKFVMDGKEFRKQIERLKLLNDPAWIILQSKYDFMRNITFGEFDRNAKVRDIENERKELEFAGLDWDQQSGFLTVKPNLDVLPERRHIERTFLGFDKGLIREIDVGFSYNPRKRSYTLSLRGITAINKILLCPFQGDDRIFYFGMNSGPYLGDGETEIRIGAVPSLELKLSELFNNSNTYWRLLELEFKSFSPIQPGQKRFIVDNEWNSKVPALRRQPDKLEQDTPRVRSYEIVHINEGPVEAFDQYTGKIEKFWNISLITEFPGEPKEKVEKGWVSERWIGEEIPAEENRNLSYIGLPARP